MGLGDLRVRTAVPPHRRLRGRGQLAAEPRVLPRRRRHHQGREQARRDRLVPAIAGGGLHLDIGRGSVVELPAEETERRWAATNPEWPIAHVVTHGVSRDQFMARHKANHAQLAYASDAATADAALVAKAVAFQELGVTVHLCGEVRV
ncbi:hypothetical protein [Streptomyces sp. NPDC055400]